MKTTSRNHPRTTTPDRTVAPRGRRATGTGQSLPARARALPLVLALALVPLAAVGATSPARARGASTAGKQYLAALHKKIHVMWVDTVLSRAQRELGPRDPFNNPKRKVVLRLHFSPDGDIQSAKVKKSSGHRAFDATAQSAVLGLYDFPRPPPSARSDDGHVYVDWTFHRGRPWCHHGHARITKVPFTVTLLGRGKLGEAITMLTRAQRQGRLERYGRDFGQRLIGLAIRSQGSKVAGALLPVLRAAQPPRVWRTVLRGALTDAQLATALERLAKHPTPETRHLLATLFSIHYPAHPSRAAVLLDGMARLPKAARHCKTKLVQALGSDHVGLAAAAARVLMRAAPGTDAARRAEKRLLTLLESRKAADNQAAAARVDAHTATPAIEKALKKLVLHMNKPVALKAALARRLGEVGSKEAGKMLLMLTYSKRDAIRLPALEALSQVREPKLARCYRMMTLIKARKVSAAARRAAARTMARTCLGGFASQIERAARRLPGAVRLGLAEGLPGADPRATKILKRLARDLSRRIRHTAWANMLAHPRPEWRRPLRRAKRKQPKVYTRLECRHPHDLATRKRCFSGASPEAKLRLARALITTDPGAVFPWLLEQLRSKSWEKRLQAAWVLIALPHRS